MTFLQKNYISFNNRILYIIIFNAKNKKIDIRGSPSVTHKTTNQTLSRLTSEFGWDPVHST